MRSKNVHVSTYQFIYSRVTRIRPCFVVYTMAPGPLAVSKGKQLCLDQNTKTEFSVFAFAQ